MKRYGIFGGTFNPPHIAHSIVAESVKEQMQLDKIIFIPAGNPPLKESISPEHRLAMSNLAFGDDNNFEVSDIEIRDGKIKSYTVNTLERLREIYTDKEVTLSLIIGVDNLIDLPRWKDPEKLFTLAEVVVINRPNYSPADSKPEFAGKVKFVNVPFLEISSTTIRENVRNGKSIKYFVRKKVGNYIRENNLYKL